MHGLATTGAHNTSHLYNTTLQKHTNYTQGWANMGQNVQILMQDLNISDCDIKTVNK